MANRYNEPSSLKRAIKGLAKAFSKAVTWTYYRVKGDPFEDETEEQRKRRKEKLDQFNRELKAEMDAPPPGKAGMETDTPPPDEDGWGRKWWAKLYHYMGLRIRVHDKYLTVTAGKQISDRQLRIIVMIGVLEKGWKTLYFYDRKGKHIDPQLTARANAMVQELSLVDHKERKGPLRGYPAQVSETRMEGLEPWKRPSWRHPLRFISLAFALAASPLTGFFGGRKVKKAKNKERKRAEKAADSGQRAAWGFKRVKKEPPKDPPSGDPPSEPKP